jgi:hypothetical protein
MGFGLCRLTLAVQAAVLDVLLFDAPPFSQDGFTATEVDVSRAEVADAFVVSGFPGVCLWGEGRCLRSALLRFSQGQIRYHKPESPLWPASFRLRPML